MKNIFFGKTIIVTGHTGFKGSWLSLWLKSMGSKVIGISKDIPTSPSNFKAIKLNKTIEDLRCNINDLEAIKKIFKQNKPDFVFHLAAQPLVNEAYLNPLETFTTNGIGTLNILESLRELNKKCVAIFITSDK